MERIADVEKVLMNEIDNLHGVYLYLEGDSWCAYERSAYYLAKLNVPVILQKEVIREGYDVVLLKALFIWILFGVNIRLLKLMQGNMLFLACRNIMTKIAMFAW